MAAVATTLYVFANEEARLTAISSDSTKYSESNTFAGLTDAVKSASGDVVIELAAGTYADNITFRENSVDGEEVIGEPVKNITIKAAEGVKQEDVVLSGTMTLGYRKQGTGAEEWGAKVVFEGITFDHAATGVHSLVVEDIQSLTVNNCAFIGDGEYSIGSASGNNSRDVDFTGCTFTNGGAQILGQFGCNVKFDTCTFNDYKLNWQGGGAPGGEMTGCTFNSTLADAHKGDSFYLVRTNACNVKFDNCVVNIDADLTGDAGTQAKWNVFWARNNSDAPWTLEGVEVNMTDKALAQTELNLVKNECAASGNERITFTDLSSTSNSVEELLAKTSGVVNSIDTANGTYTQYTNGEAGAAFSKATVYVDSSYTAENVGEGMLFGFNAFTSVGDAVDAVKDGGTIVVSGTDTIISKADLKGKDVTITGTAVFDWEKGFVMVGNEKANDKDIATLTFENAKITTIDSNKSGVETYGLNIRTPKKGNTASGKVYIKGDSQIELSYLFDRNEMYVEGTGEIGENPTLTVYGGFAVSGRTADESAIEGGNTAVFKATNGAYVLVKNMNGMGVGHEGKGSLEIEDSKFVVESDFKVHADSALKVTNGTLQVNKTLTNNGTLTVSGESTLNIETLNGGISIQDATLLDGTQINGGDSDTVEIKNATIQGDVTILKKIYSYNALVISEGAEFAADWLYLLDNAASITVNADSVVNVDTLWNNVGPDVTRSNIAGTVNVSSKAYLRNADISGELNVATQFCVYSNSSLDVTGTVNITTSTSVGGALTLGLINDADKYAGVATFNVNGGTVAFNPVDDKQVTSNTLIIHGNGVLNVTNNGTFSVTGGISNSGTIALKDSTFTCDYGFSNSGIITMDASSLLVADNITGITDTNKIRITVDVDSFTGFNKLIDLSRSTENTLEDEVIYVDANGNEITAETLAENDIRAIYSADGDISLAKLGDKIVYVNSAWENQNDVDATFGADSGIIYSENAFSSMTDVTAPETATSLHILGGNYANPFGDKSSDEVNLLKGGITTVAADNGTVTLTLGNLVFNSKNAGEYNINGNFALTDYGRQLWVNNKLEQDWSTNGSFVFTGVEGTVYNIDGNLAAGDAFLFDGVKAVISADSLLTTADVKKQSGDDVEEYVQMNIYNSEVINNGKIKIDLTESENGSLLNVGEDNGEAATLTVSGKDASLYVAMVDADTASWADYYRKKEVNLNNGKLNVEEGASFETTGAVNVYDNFAITVTGGATFSAGIVSSVSSAGSITVSDGATFSAETVEAFGTVTVTGGASFEAGYFNNTLVDSGVMEGDPIVMSGNFYVGAGEDGVTDKNILKLEGFDGKITLKDEAYIDKGSSVTASGMNPEIVVEDDATLYWNTVSGAAISVGDDLSFEGVEFTDGSAIVYDGMLSWSSDVAEGETQDLIINGMTVIWNNSEKTSGAIVDDNYNVYSVTVDSTGITADLDEDYKVVSLKLGSAAPGAGADYYTFTVDAIVTGGAGDYTFSADAISGDNEWVVDGLSYNDGKVTLVLDPEKIAADGTVSIAITAEDKYGIPDTQEIELTVDKTAPVIGDFVVSPAEWTNGSVTISFTAEDFGSGIYDVFYVVGEDDDPEQYSDSLFADENGIYTLTVDANKTGYIRVTDNAFNNIVREFGITQIDKVNPVVSDVVYAGEQIITATVSASDSYGEIAGYMISNDGVTWGDLISGDVCNIEFTENGSCYVKFVDKAGNESEAKFVEVNSFVPAPEMPDDTIAPVIENFAAVLQADGMVKITFTVKEEGGSGLFPASVFYIVGEDGDPDQHSDCLSADENGVYTLLVEKDASVYFSVSDNAYNYSELVWDGKYEGGNSGDSEGSVSGNDEHKYVSGDMTGDNALKGDEIKDLASLTTEAGSKVEVNDSIEFDSGVNTMNIGYGSTFTAEDIDASKGSVSVIGIGAESKAEVGAVDLGTGYNVMTVGWNSDVSTKTISGVTALITSGGTESVLDVAGNIEFGSGVNTMNIGYGSTFTAENIDASKGSVSMIVIGAESKAEVGEVNLGEGYNVVTAGWNSEVSTGAISGVTALITATESVLDVAGDIEFGSGVNTMNIGYASEFIAGNVIMGDSSDWIGIGAESDVMLGDLDFGEGHDSMYIGWKADVEIGAISGLEELWVDAGATIAVADIADLEGVGGNWKQANIFEKGTLG